MAQVRPATPLVMIVLGVLTFGLGTLFGLLMQLTPMHNTPQHLLRLTFNNQPRDVQQQVNVSAESVVQLAANASSQARGAQQQASNTTEIPKHMPDAQQSACNLTATTVQPVKAPEQLWVPDRLPINALNQINISDIEQPVEGFLPTKLSSLYPSTELGKDKQPMAFHWVIKSCNRTYFGRYLATTLMSGLLGGLKPASISIVYCKPFPRHNQDSNNGSTDAKAGDLHPDALPSILYNLRNSHQVNVFFASPSVQDWQPCATTLTALTVPHMLGDETLPVLITEDDIAFAPNANARLSLAYTKLKPMVGSDPWALHLYVGKIMQTNQTQRNWQAIPLKELEQHGITYVSDNMNNSADPMPPFIMLDRRFLWGTQAQMFSPAMVKMLRYHFERAFVAWKNNDTTSEDGQWHDLLEDLVIKGGLEVRYKCNQPGVPCHAFNMQPALVQHIGTHSTRVSNPRFHVAMKFPLRVRLPSPETYW